MDLLKRFGITKLRKKAKYVAGIVASAALISLAIFPSLSMKADEVARFNFMENDIELLQGLNKTQGEENWKDPVVANAGDRVALRVYFHNGKFDATGEVDTTAINTVIKAVVPAQTTNKVANITASIDADNAALVTETIVNDVVVHSGTLNGLNINFDKEATLEYLPGSTQIWTDNPVQDGVVLPDGIAGPNGVNIGDVKGCWQYSGYVTFQVQTSPRVIPCDMALTKSVRNVSDGQISFTKSTEADQSEKVEYKITVQNNGEGASSNVLVRDILPNDLAAIAGSGRIVRDGATGPINTVALLSSGIDLGAFAPNELATIYFEAIAPSAITVARTVVNRVNLTSVNCNLTDTASVVLAAGLANIERAKDAFNITQGVDAEAVVANAGDLIRYNLHTRNTGTLAANGRVIDDLIDVLEYADVTAISDHGVLLDGILQYPAFVIEPGMELSDWFEVRVKNPVPTNPRNGYSFDKVMFNEYGEDEVIIRVNVPVLASVLSIDKLVRNVTSNSLEYVNANTAYAGDVLEYKISFANTGNAPADYVKVFDVLPANVSLDTSVPAIINLNGQERSISENIVDGFTITSLVPGQEGYVRFRAIISSGVAANETLVNKGYLQFGVKTISDNAETVIISKAIKVSTPVVMLPKSGASNEVIALVAALIVIAGTVLAAKKMSA